MDLIHNTISFVSTYLLLIFFIIFLRFRNIVKKSDVDFIANLTVNIVLPALIISKLVFIKLTSEILTISLAIFMAEIIVFFTSYFCGKYLLKLNNPSLGVFILCSTVGSTAILGIVFVSAIFEENTYYISKAMIISQIASGIPANIMFPIVCGYFGEKTSSNVESLFKTIKKIILSPTIMAAIIGLLWAILQLPTEGLIITPIIQAADYIGMSLFLMVALLVGLLIDKISIKEYFMPILICLSLLLILEPLLVYYFSTFFDISVQNEQIAFILSGMPASNAIIAFSIKYKCNAKLAVVLVLSSVIIGCFSLVFLMYNIPIFK